MRLSFRSVGDCYDNALCESFFASLECELLDRRRITTKMEARVMAFRPSTGGTTPHRRHSVLASALLFNTNSTTLPCGHPQAQNLSAQSGQIHHSDFMGRATAGFEDATRAIKDPIAGTTLYTEEEIRIVDHSLFRRLHRIRQNGLLYYVFPAATHTRFEHSLGVVKGADDMLRALLRNGKVAQRKKAAYSLGDKKHLKAVDLSPIEGSATFEQDSKLLSRIFRVTRLAALAHDFGHGAFSHTFDSFAPPASRIADLVRREPKLEQIRDFARYIDQGVGVKEGRIEHEAMSCVFFAYVCAHKPDDTIPSEVTAVIMGLPELVLDEKLKPYVHLMHAVVASAPLDADRMDYFERDSRSIGVTYGLFDRDRLEKSLLPYYDKKEDRFLIGFKRSGLRAIENFMQARFQLYSQIYFHKTNAATSKMLEQIAALAESRGIDPFEFKASLDLEDLVKVYEELSDERFLNVLRGKDSDWTLTDRDINKLAEDLFQRKLWKRVFEGTETDMKWILKKLRRKFPHRIFHEYKADPGGAKDIKKAGKLLERGVSGYYEVAEALKWSKVTPVIEALSGQENVIRRIYVGNDTTPSGDVDSIKQHVRTLLTTKP